MSGQFPCPFSGPPVSRFFLFRRRVPAVPLLLCALLFVLAAPCAGSGASSAAKPLFLPLTPPETQGTPAPESLPPQDAMRELARELAPELDPDGAAPDLPEDMPPLPGASGRPDAARPRLQSPAPPPDAKEMDLQRRGIVRAELRPGRPRLLAAPFPAILETVLVRDGERVKEGRIVARFDALAAQKVVEEARNILAGAIERVQNARGASAREQEGAGEQLARDADKLREAEERLAASTLAAPFNGRVTEVRASAGQHMKRGDVVMELAEEGDLEILCTVPSTWIKHLSPGHVIWVFVEETAKSYEATFVRFGGKVDPVSKSIRAYSRFVETPEELMPGMSGRADFFPRRGS